MNYDLRGRSVTKLIDFSTEEITYLIDLAEQLKKDKQAGQEQPHLQGKNVALIFEKDSTRTRCAFEVGAFDQGAHITYIGPSGGHMGSKETVADTARVLGRMYDGIQYRGFAQTTVETLAEYAGVPVWNGLTDEFHPTQILADFLTIREHVAKPFSQVKLTYVGDGRNNMGNSLMVGAAKLGIDFRIAAPAEFQPESDLIEQCQNLAKLTGAKILVTDDVDLAIAGTDAVYTDVWVSMGESKAVWKDRIAKLKAYQVDAAMMAKADAKAIFMHCLPAFHNNETLVAKEIEAQYGMSSLEVTEEVFEGPQSVVFDEAENRMHTIKAVMVATMANEIVEIV